MWRRLFADDDPGIRAQADGHMGRVLMDSATPGVGRHQRQADQWAARFLATLVATRHKPVIHLMDALSSDVRLGYGKHVIAPRRVDRMTTFLESTCAMQA